MTLWPSPKRSRLPPHRRRHFCEIHEQNTTILPPLIGDDAISTGIARVFQECWFTRASAEGIQELSVQNKPVAAQELSPKNNIAVIQPPTSARRPGRTYKVAEKKTGTDQSHQIAATAQLTAGVDVAYPTLNADYEVGEKMDEPPQFSNGMSFTSFPGRVVSAVGEHELQSTPPLAQLAPPKFSYPDIKPLAVGRSMSLAPKIRGKAEKFVVEPVLPDGLQLHSITGVISGTPTVAASRTTYKITAQNCAGVASILCHITVVAPPSHLTSSLVIYPYPAVRTLTKGEHVELLPRIVGLVDEFSVEPELPVGLSLDVATGLISGSPIAVSDMETYTLTARNVFGTTTTKLTLGVRALRFNSTSKLKSLSGVTVQTLPELFPRNAVVSDSVKPMLPSGIFLDRQTGVIRWEPNVMDQVLLPPLAFLEDKEDDKFSHHDNEMGFDEEDDKGSDREDQEP